MGFRFRKSKKIGPFRVNVSKSGIGWSVGTKGARFTKRADGKTQTTLSVPGTGISYVDVHGDNKASSGVGNNNSNKNDYDKKPKVPFYKKTTFIWLLLFILPPLGIILMWGNKKYNKKPRIALSIVFALYSFIIYGSNNNTVDNNLANNNPKIEASSKGNKNSTVNDQSEKEKAEKEKADAEKAEKEKLEKERLEKEKIAAEEAEKKKIAEEQAVAQEKAAAEEAEKQRVAQEQAAQAQALAQQESQAQVNQEPQASQPVVGRTVYVASSGKGKKYHSNSSCSDMNGVVELSIDEATGRGYTACKKCY